MQEYISNLWDTNFMPHGHCYFWEPGIMWSHAISDSVIALAYFFIPLSLIKIVRSRKEDEFNYMWMLILFAIFILGCGATHVMDVINIWQPFYRIDSALRIITALASIGTAVMLIKITPQLIMVPSGKKWREINEELTALNESLEEKVQERTVELQQLADRYAFMANSIPQIVWTSDAAGKVNFLNSRWYEYTGMPEGTLGSQDSFIHPTDMVEVEPKLRESQEQGSPFEMKLRIRNKDGQYRWHLSRTRPMRNEQGQVIKWFGSSTDIHEQVEQTQKLSRINEELDTFVYTASHDLKAPIHNLEGLLSMKRERFPATNEQVLRLEDMMLNSVERLKNVITDLGDIDRVMREEQEPAQWVSLPELVEEFKASHLMMLEKSGAEFNTEFSSEEVLTLSRKHMRSLLDNLLNNSLQYRHPERRLQLTLKVEETDQQYRLTVEDNGLGIPADQHQKVFSMFKRYHTHVPGTGAGLYIVKKIVERAGGTVHLESHEEIGTTFIITLPKAK